MYVVSAPNKLKSVSAMCQLCYRSLYRVFQISVYTDRCQILLKIEERLNLEQSVHFNVSKHEVIPLAPVYNL